MEYGTIVLDMKEHVPTLRRRIHAVQNGFEILERRSGILPFHIPFHSAFVLLQHAVLLQHPVCGVLVTH